MITSDLGQRRSVSHCARRRSLAVEYCVDFLLCSFTLTAITPVMATCAVDSVLT